YFRYLRGEESRPPTRLLDSRPFVRLNDLAYIAAGTITPVSEEYLTRATTENKDDFTTINGIGDICATFLADGRFPSQQGLPWAQPGGRAGVEDLPRLPAVVESMLAKS